jgi:hypothetical protein
MEFIQYRYTNKQYLQFVDGDIIECEVKSALAMLLRLSSRGIQVSQHLFAHCLK